MREERWKGGARARPSAAARFIHWLPWSLDWIDGVSLGRGLWVRAAPQRQLAVGWNGVRLQQGLPPRGRAGRPCEPEGSVRGTAESQRQSDEGWGEEKEREEKGQHDVADSRMIMAPLLSFGDRRAAAQRRMRF